MRNIVNILLCFLLSYSIGNAQSIKRSVICSFGSSNSISNTHLSSTLGQPSNIGTISDVSNYIRQGFQQPLNNQITIYGCTDSTAFNFNVLATIDDGSCFYCNDTLITFVYTGSPQSFIVPTGLDVIKVHAYGAVLVDPEIGKAGDIDTAVISLKFANSALGIIENSRKAVYGYDQRVEVFGSKGTALADNNTPTSMVVFNELGTIRDKPLYFFLERYEKAFIAEMQAFVNAVRENEPTAVSGKDGLAPVLIAIAAQQSLKSRKPVKVESV